MDRAQATGFGVATAGHVALFAALSLGLAVTRLPPPQSPPIEVSFVKDVGLTSAAPEPIVTPPAPSAAPEAGPPEEAAPEPAPPLPAPPAPVPPPRPQPVATRPPQPAPKPAPAPVPAKPVPHAAAPQPVAKPAPAKPVPQPTASHGGTAQATHGSRLSVDFLKGIGSDPTQSTSQQAQASVMSAEALAGISAAIKRQIQPCANRQVNPGPGANQIKVTLSLRLNRDGSLARTPSVVRTAGVSGENSRYEDRVKDLAIAAYVGCSPLRGLPDELYQTPKGGWANINMTYNLP
jgi:outer membrane biosynthesis protein TonB